MSWLKAGAWLGVGATMAIVVVGCAQMNKPIRPLRNRPPVTTGTDALDAGESSDGGAPAPAITAQPGDIHL